MATATDQTWQDAVKSGCQSGKKDASEKGDITNLAQMASVLEQNDTLTREVVEDVLSRYKGTDYQKYVVVDNGGRYNRGNVCTGSDNKFCILVMTWNAAQGSAIHSHGASECSLLLLDGEHLEERVYRTQAKNDLDVGQSMEVNIDVSEMNQGASQRGSIGYVNDSIGPHAIWNNDQNRHAVSLHVYYPAYDKCWVFDDSTGDGRIALVSACADAAPCTKANDVDAATTAHAGSKPASEGSSVLDDLDLV
jgi:hypothetical protein